MGMRRLAPLLAMLLLTALLLSGCRFAAVETGSVRIETPTATPEATRQPDET